MKNFKTLISTGLLIIGTICFSGLAKAQPISLNLFGQNAWMPDTIGNASACIEPPCILYGKLHNNWTKIQQSSTSIIRFGGIAPDRNKPTNYQYLRIIDSVRAKGMEPIIQVPFYNYRYTAVEAANIVYYLNVTKGKNIKYFIIGNEPDLKYSFTTAAQVAAYIKPFATAMKNVDPSIKIIGPECAWYNSGILNGLTNPGGADDITGTDANGRYYIDIISFHYYPFNGTQTRAQVITKLTAVGGVNDNLVTLNSRLATANTYHGRTGANALKTAITEANVNYKNSSTDNLSSMGANSFIGGQFVAEMLGVGMKNNVEMINLWSVVEGNTTEFNIGYIDKVTGNKKPLYHHFKLLADNFKGNYITATDNVTNVKTLASQNGTQIAVMIMNQELTGSLNYTLRLNTGTVSGTNPLKININAGVALQYSDAIANQSSTLLVFNSTGVLIKKCEYSLANHAMLNIGPTCVDYLASPLPVALLSFNAVLESQNRVVFNWATASQTNNDFFSIEKTTDGIHFETIAVVDGAGTSNQTLTYTTNDEQPSKGVSYYRLRQTDFDGQSEAFGMEEIKIGMEETEFVVYPNPFNGLDLSINITTHMNNEKLRLVLYDVQGRKVWEKNHFFEESGQRNIEVDLSERLPAGMYFLNAESGKQKFNQKLIVN